MRPIKPIILSRGKMLVHHCFEQDKTLNIPVNAPPGHQEDKEAHLPESPIIASDTFGMPRNAVSKVTRERDGTLSHHDRLLSDSSESGDEFLDEVEDSEEDRTYQPASSSSADESETADSDEDFAQQEESTKRYWEACQDFMQQPLPIYHASSSQDFQLSEPGTTSLIDLYASTPGEEIQCAPNSSDNNIEKSHEVLDEPRDSQAVVLVSEENHNFSENFTEEGSRENDPKKKSRKRTADPSSWGRNIKKFRVNAGLSYKTKKGKVVPSKTVKGACSNIDPKCRLACTARITSEIQKSINEKYWKSLGSSQLRRNFVVAHSKKTSKKICNAKVGCKPRGENVQFFLTVNGEQIRVCKKMFMNTLNVSDKFIRNCWKKVDCNGIVGKDLKGKHSNRPNRLSAEIKTSIRDHINSFARIDSHYLRNQTSREYLDGSLTIAEMYRMYVAAMKKNNQPFAKKCAYENTFNTEFNLGFFIPKKDQCTLCTSYSNSSPEEKQKMEEKYQQHQLNKEAIREEKRRDAELSKEDQTSSKVVCYDLQAVLQTPCGEVNSLYYKRKLNCFNFTLYDIGCAQGHCYFWNESIANRGVNEIGSFVLHFLKNFCVGKDVIFYSDNCVGQQKNKAMACMYIHAVTTMDIPSITHKYLIVGHTQNEGDAMHSTIEREKKRVLKMAKRADGESTNIPIAVPQHWTSVLRNAKKTGKPFIVNEVATEEVVDLKQLEADMQVNFKINSAKEKVLWTEMKVIKIVKGESVLKYKTDHRAEEFKEICIERRRAQGRPPSKKLSPAYKKPPKIPAAKAKDLMDLCQNNIIPKVHHSFYKSLN